MDHSLIGWENDEDLTGLGNNDLKFSVEGKRDERQKQVIVNVWDKMGLVRRNREQTMRGAAQWNWYVGNTTIAIRWLKPLLFCAN